jgi:hypothetical protein
MAERYGLLPHEVKNRATTYDIMITDVLASYEDYEQRKANGKQIDPNNHGYSVDELQQMMGKVRGNE